MNYVDGLDAALLLTGRASEGLPIDRVVPIVEAVAGALDYAHKQGLLHRDVKPANIMLSHADDEGQHRILLTDFGIARNVGEISGLTATNMTVGTVAYSAPEQLLGEDLDGRADQYALAATAFHLLTGSQLFPHSNPAVVIGKHLNATPPSLAASRPELSGLDPVLAFALAKNPNDRFGRCIDFARALAEQASTRSSPGSMEATTPATVLPKLARHPRAPAAPLAADQETALWSRNRWLISGAVAATVLSAGVIAFKWHPGPNDEPKPPSVTATTPTATTAASPSTAAPPSTTSTPAAPKIIDVDPADYQSPGDPGYYHWTYATTPIERICSIFPGGVACEVTFPPGTPEVTNAYLSGPPNEVWIKPPDGPTDMVDEGGSGGQTIKTLLPNHRITVGDFTCTSLTGGGVDCEAPTGGFTFAGGVLTKRSAR